MTVPPRLAWQYLTGGTTLALPLPVPSAAANRRTRTPHEGAAAWYSPAHGPATMVPQVELDEGVLRKLAGTARACLNPMAAMFGGVVGQEVRQWCVGRGGWLVRAAFGRSSFRRWRFPMLPVMAAHALHLAFPVRFAVLTLPPSSNMPPSSPPLPPSLLPPLADPTAPPPLPPTLLAPQVVKAASGKFHPLHQWFYFDSIESLPDEPLAEEEVAPQVGTRRSLAKLGWAAWRHARCLRCLHCAAAAFGACAALRCTSGLGGLGRAVLLRRHDHDNKQPPAAAPLVQGSRYDDNIAVFGRSLQAKVEGLKVFLVRAVWRGCGVVWCGVTVVWCGVTVVWCGSGALLPRCPRRCCCCCCCCWWWWWWWWRHGGGAEGVPGVVRCDAVWCASQRRGLPACHAVPLFFSTPAPATLLPSQPGAHPCSCHHPATTPGRRRRPWLRVFEELCADGGGLR